jgi:hypothetical protein
MRFLAKIQIPVDVGNEKVKDGSLGKTLQAILMQQKPEAVYFTDPEGLRTVIMILNIANASDIPGISEPWFLAFNATVEFHIALVQEDMAAAEPAWAQAVAAFGGGPAKY